MKKNFQSVFIIVILLLFFLFYLKNITLMMSYFLDYSQLFLTKLVPVSFPFFLLSTLLIEYDIVYFLPIKSSYVSVFFLSLLSGFPSGSKYTRELLERKMIPVEEGNQLLVFSHFPNPLFVFGTIRSILNFSLATKIFCSIFFSNFLLLSFCKRKRNLIQFSKKQNYDFSESLKKAIFSSWETILLIYGTSLFFYLFSVFITHYFSFSTPTFVFLCGVFDLVKGVFATSLLSETLLRSYFILFFLSFGTISIHMQTKSILSDTSLSYFAFLKGRILGTILSFILFSIFLLLY